MNRTLIGIALCVVLGRGVAFGVGAADIAQKAHNADKDVSYRGVKTASVSANGATMSSVVKIVHLKPDMTRKEFFSPLALAGTILIMDGTDVWRYTPREGLWEQVRCESVGECSPCSRALSNYDIQLVGTEKVAGRDTYLIRAIPRHPSDRTHAMWVDKHCYLTLRTQTETVGGRVVSSSWFTTIEINPKDISLSAFAVTGKVKTPTKPGRADFQVRKPTYLPKGYRLVSVSRVSANCHYCAHLQFSNGANTISLFERRTGVETAAPRVPDKLSTIVTWTREGVLFTLIGDLSRDELKKIADSTK